MYKLKIQMFVYVIYSVYFDPQEYKYTDPPYVSIVGVYSEQLTALKLVCAKQMQEYIEKEYCIDELPEFPDVNDSIETYIEYFDTITNPIFQGDINHHGMEYYWIDTMKLNHI